MVGFKKPTNKIVAAGRPLVQELKIETVTNLYPGRLVKKGTNDDDIVVNTAANPPVGWLGYEQANPAFKPASVDTIYGAAEDLVPVLNGGGFVVVGRLASGQSVVKGDPLVPVANGELAKGAALTITASGAANITDGQAVTGSGYGSEGPIVGYAEETVDASAAAKDIMVRSMI